jgi:signal recognition particle subunit SRP54
MFDELGSRLDAALKKLRERGVLTEPMIKDGLREVRRVLLEADVNFQVTRDFLERVQQRALGEAVLKAVSPGQQIVKIVHDELARLFGEGRPTLAVHGTRTSVILMVGLQGSGKTTTAAKLARRLGRGGSKAMLAACDLQRPAAIDQRSGGRSGFRSSPESSAATRSRQRHAPATKRMPVATPSSLSIRREDCRSTSGSWRS